MNSLKEILSPIVADHWLHARFLNTLSLMENTGARKISKCEDPEQVELIMLKHAAEEARHSYYLKKQIIKLSSLHHPKIEKELATYSNQALIAARASKNYLNLLDIKICKYLKSIGFNNLKDLKYSAYLLVTYAIEVRADEIYPIYQELLTEANSKVNVKSIIAEEEGHLEEMINQMQQFWGNEWSNHAEAVIKIETELFNEWKNALRESTKKYQLN